MDNSKTKDVRVGRGSSEHSRGRREMQKVGSRAWCDTRAAPLRVRSLRAVDSLASLLPCVHSRASLGYDSSTWSESFHGDDIVGLLRGAAPRCSPRVARPSRQSCGGQTGHQRWARHCGRKGHQEGCLLRRRRNAGRYTPGRWRADAAALRLTSWGQAACCA